MSTAHSSTATRLSVMMFLQFFAWGSWFVTLALAMGNNGLEKFIGGAFESAPIAAIIAPLFLGLVADRLFSSERVMGVLMLIGGGIMCAIATIAPQGAEKGGLIVWLMIAYMLCYMPTLGLGNTITFTHWLDCGGPCSRSGRLVRLSEHLLAGGHLQHCLGSL